MFILIKIVLLGLSRVKIKQASYPTFFMKKLNIDNSLNSLMLQTPNQLYSKPSI